VVYLRTRRRAAAHYRDLLYVVGGHAGKIERAAKKVGDVVQGNAIEHHQREVRLTGADGNGRNAAAAPSWRCFFGCCGPLVGDGKMDAGLPPSPPTVWPIYATAVENREPAVVRGYVLLNGKEHGIQLFPGCTNSSLVLTGIGSWNDPRSSRHRT
jgi:hypothetical protein